MTKRMLIDATHAEETRVVVLEGNRLEDFDVETQSRRQLKGNIYLAKVVRVEPSLQAAFVEYGGNRHGFLAFGEIHPDYYQIPVADRQRLLQMQEEEARAEEEAFADSDGDALDPAYEPRSAALDIDSEAVEGPARGPGDADSESGAANGDNEPAFSATGLTVDFSEVGADTAPEAGEPAPDDANAPTAEADETRREASSEDHLGSRVQEIPVSAAPPPETIGGDSEQAEDAARERRSQPRFLRNYKIQEVIRRRQIMLIQVVKEERGTKGAALTTYISLAGRFCVLMPNSPRGGGISRKITSATDRRRLKEVTAELEIPRGMGLIVRTAGANRPKPEIKRDCEYLLRLWDEIRELTMQSVAPALIYEEASLIKRAIRDVYSRDVDEILVDGEEGWKAARDFMRMLMPTHVKKVQLWRDGGVPLFARQQVEAQLDAMLHPTVQLRSGGYLVINQTEALVAIDVNSGRSTRERGIEETAFRTNMEAAEEVARQLRLRDLAGLIVIDFIDMESKKNISAVERRLKEALKNDRARIQVGHISHFGLMEMSRQRLRPSLAETSLSTCPHCGGTGHVRSTDSAALHVLRAIEEEGGKRRAAEILVHVAGPIAFYILNNKRQRLSEIEERYSMRVGFAPDDTLLQGDTRIERVRAQTIQDLPPPVTQTRPAEPQMADISDDDTAESLAADAETNAEGDTDTPDNPADQSEEAKQRRRRRRRRRGGAGRREDGQGASDAAPMPPDAEQPVITDVVFAGAVPLPVTPHVNEAIVNQVDTVTVDATESTDGAEVEDEQGGKPSRGRRGGRRRKRPQASVDIATEPSVPAYVGPTPADPFGNHVLDIFDVIDAQAEQAEPARGVKQAAIEPQVTLPAPEIPSAKPAPMVSQEAEPAPATPTPSQVAEQQQPEIGPAIKPIVIGEGEPTAEKKRGWWRK